MSRPPVSAKPEPAEKPKEAAVKDPGPEVINPVVLSTLGDRVFVRINPKQTLLVSKGGSAPGLGVLRQVDAAGAHFDSRTVPLLEK